MIRNRTQFTLIALALYLLAGTAFGQKPTPAPAPKPPKTTTPRPSVHAPVAPPEFPSYQTGGVTSEKAVATDNSVNIKLCVLEGRLKINGWQRDEVRVFVKNGSKFGLKVLEKNPESSKPVWVLVMAVAETRTPGRTTECIAGETVEVDVPMGASLNVSGRSTQTSVDSVKKISFKNVEGSVSLRNITGGIVASTYQGDLTVENSGGAISLESGTGNIAAYEVTPGQVGDLFKVKTNSGAISLQQLAHRQIEANSISGTLLFNGKFLDGGLYNFKTSKGDIRLLLPGNTSCTVQATYGYGSFNSDLPLKKLTENLTPNSSTVVAKIGGGESCNVRLISSTGSIGIKKQ
ncbi:MAG TPA: DUF4097 family beta strand repeat-containing protein [Pyrinomonadaceae bacterium]|nr:DUF4097 family beta strand repeat-containing protein [Pyrinomonadaceae bacterium]